MSIYAAVKQMKARQAARSTEINNMPGFVLEYANPRSLPAPKRTKQMYQRYIRAHGGAS